MKELVFLVEEPSIKELLNGILPKVLPKEVSFKIIKHEGKTDLQKSIPRKLRAYQKPGVEFVVLIDQDSNDCRQLKLHLFELCEQGRRTDALIRIVCHELESWFLGDLRAVEEAFGMSGLARRQQETKFRDPDRLANPSEILKSLVPGYQKVSGARSISKYMNPDVNNSTSFAVFLDGLKRVCLG